MDPSPWFVRCHVPEKDSPGISNSTSVRIMITRSNLVCFTWYVQSMARSRLWGIVATTLGGYFLIDGAERVVISQETFANYASSTSRLRKMTTNQSHICQIRSISEDPSKPRAMLLQMHHCGPISSTRK